MSEQVFYNQDGITVTNSRFVVHDQTYAMSGITSVKLSKNCFTWQNIMKIGLLPLIMLPLSLLLPKGIASFLVFAVLIVGFFLIRHNWVIVLTTSSGEVKALENKDKAVVSEIVNALNSAIIARG